VPPATESDTTMSNLGFSVLKESATKELVETVHWGDTK